MPTYSERVELAGDPAFIGRCRSALLECGLDVAANPSAPPADVRLLRSVLADTERYAALFAKAAVTDDWVGIGVIGDPRDPAVNSAEGDVALQSLVSSTIWPAFAREASP